MSRPSIDSWKEAQTVAPAVLERLNADPPLLMAAATNPLLALEELGYDIAPHRSADAGKHSFGYFACHGGHNARRTPIPLQ